jgi:septum site-determining protein MinD
MLAVAGGKGGTGTTTTTLGLAAALAGQRRRPLAVDADARAPNLGLVAGVESEDGCSGVARVTGGEAVADAARVPERFPGVDVLPAEPGDDVRGALTRLGDRCPVLVDCPSTGGRAAALPLQFADAVVMVTTAWQQAIADSRKTARMARELDVPVAGVAVSRTDAVPAGVASAFDAPAVAVPTAHEPLSDSGVRAAHDRLAEQLSHQGEFPTVARSEQPNDLSTTEKPLRGNERGRVLDEGGRRKHCRERAKRATEARSEAPESRTRGLSRR